MKRRSWNRKRYQRPSQLVDGQALAAFGRRWQLLHQIDQGAAGARPDGHQEPQTDAGKGEVAALAVSPESGASSGGQK
jgi:hypothetical protein